MTAASDCDDSHCFGFHVLCLENKEGGFCGVWGYLAPGVWGCSAFVNGLLVFVCFQGILVSFFLLSF